MIRVLKELNQLSILYKAAQTTYASSRAPCQRYDAETEITASPESGIPRLEKSPVSLGRIQLDDTCYGEDDE
jgi:hypothetical protein